MTHQGYRSSLSAPSDLRVVQTVFGRFHHFDLARQLHARGALEKIFTAYPRCKLRGENLPEKRIDTFPWLMAPLMAKWRMGWLHENLDRELSWLMAESLDRHVARNLPAACNAFVAISGSGLHTARRAREQEAVYICDRGSSHIRFSDRVLREENKCWGAPFRSVDPRSMGKEEAEYFAADAITVPSSFARRSFEKEGVPAEKLRVIPYGVDLQRFSPGTPPDNAFEVLFVGQVSFRKGVPYLLDGFRRLRHPRKRLTLVGAVLPEIADTLRRFLGPETRVLGPQPREVVRETMRSSHVLVLPSIEDGFGLVLAEAMACGCAVIASEHTGGPDLIADGREGFIVPIRDSQIIADRLERLCQREIHEPMREAALQRVREIGGWNDYGNRFVEILGQLIGRSHIQSPQTLSFACA